MTNQAPHIAEEEQQFMELRPSEDNSAARFIMMNVMMNMAIDLIGECDENYENFEFIEYDEKS